MEKVKDKGIHFTAEKITEDIKNTKIYHNFYTDVQPEEPCHNILEPCHSTTSISDSVLACCASWSDTNISVPEGDFYLDDSDVSESSSKEVEYDPIDSRSLQRMVSSTSVVQSDFKHTLLDLLHSAGKQNELKNTVYHWVRQNSNYDSINGFPIKEPLSYLRKAQLGWEKRIYKSLNTMCSELEFPLARARLPSDRQELTDKWGELGQYEVDLTQCRPVYAPKDFLEVILWVRSPNFSSSDPAQPSWDFSQIPIKTKSLWHLKYVYSDIARGEALLGINPTSSSTVASYPTLEAERSALGEKVYSMNHAPVAQEFLKRGCPRALRGQIWALALGSTTKDSDREYFYELKEMVLGYDLMTDKLILKDILLTASNDDQFFVFQDVLYQVILLFSRDTEVLNVFSNSSASPIHAVLKNRPYTVDNTVAYPPSGVVPFHGFTMFVSQFCYLYDDPVDVYFTFRAFYVRYFYRLHEVSSNQQGLLCLCLLFERLLRRHEIMIFDYLRFLKIQPIRLAFKWLMRAFSSHLPPEQVLLLWDVIIGYDSLEILPVLAVAIFSLRRENILQADSIGNVEAILADLSSIEVMPLIQLALLRNFIH